MKVLHHPLVTTRHRLGMALLASACAHLVLLAAVWAPAPEAGNAAVGQRQGALTVVSLGVVRTPAAMQPPPTAKPGKVIKTARTASKAPVRPDSLPVSSPALALPPAPLPARPGAQFTSLFAPIISQPLGHGRWGSSAPRPVPPPDPESVRQQALVAMTQDVKQRLEGFKTAQCAMRLNVDNREATVQCNDADDTAQVWAMLQGLLRPGDPGTGGANITCLYLGQGQTLVQTCDHVWPNRTIP